MIRGLFGLVVIFAGLALVWGWILNILAIAATADAITGLLILRVVGIFMAPLGGVLGYI